MTRSLPALLLSLIFLIQGAIASSTVPDLSGLPAQVARRQACHCCACGGAACCAAAPQSQTPTPALPQVPRGLPLHSDSLLHPPAPLPCGILELLQLLARTPSAPHPLETLPPPAVAPPFLRGGGLLI